MQAMAALLEGARRPLAILGGTGWDEAAVEGMAAFAERWSLPVCTSFRRADRFRWDHQCYVGDLGIGPSPGSPPWCRRPTCCC
ncbi:hypothetical protein ACFQU7_42640 [Pseudoroseomonas wenyumeiae]